MKNEVMSNNAFVKAEQARMRQMMGDRPGVKPDMRHFNANMVNDGDLAENMARRATEGLDKKAFPVK